MKRIYNNFLIISTIAIFIGGSYLYFSKDLNSNGIVPVAFGSSLSNLSGVEVSAVNPVTENKISSDILFLTALVSLKNIKIDATLFTNKSFNKLKDNAVKIDQVQAGRINPFAPISANKSSNTVSALKVTTDQPTQITNKTVVLNGTILEMNGVTDSYFEYGPTINLGNITGTVEKSLIGAFFKNISGLNSKTTYYFKACSKINNANFCGDVVSFTTN
jgi:hypothetical protein